MPENLLTYLQQLLDTGMPFMAMRTAGAIPVLVLSQLDDLLHNEPHDKLSYGVFSKFKSNSNQVFIYGEVNKIFNYVQQPFSVTSLPVSLSKTARQKHLNLVQQALAILQSTDLVKVVLSRKQTFKTQRTHIALFARLLDAYPTANCYFFYHPKVGSWMGATPELLLNITQDTLTTMSLAGTALWEENKNHTWGKKELEEQQLVTNYIVASLADAGVKDVTAGPLETVRAGKLLHLRTMIQAAVSLEKHAAIAAALHPTPAICGIPTDQARACILAYEGYDRSYYAGYLGIVRPDLRQASYFVNLRCMELQDNEAVVYVGGGITALSNAQAEVEETIHKSQTMSFLIQ